MTRKRETASEEQLYTLLDKAIVYELLGKPAVYFELLSIGQGTFRISKYHSAFVRQLTVPS